MVTEQILPNNGYFLRVKVTDKTVTLRSIYQSLIDASWINHFFPKGDWMTASVTARTVPTIQRIASNFDNGINPVVNRDTGEKLVSEVSRRTLVEDYGYWNMPIAELFKQKIDGNPGFDFHTVTPDGTLLMFGYAYVSCEKERAKLERLGQSTEKLLARFSQKYEELPNNASSG